MSGTIFIVNAENKLVEMKPTPFAVEADFQKLLADHPALLRLAAGTTGDLLLVSQEYGIADDQGAADRWSVDHLYLTRDGVPVLVEVKRANDTRGRREVVAQMLDYAAHGTAFWSGTEIAARYQRTAEAQNADPDQRLKDFLGDEDAEPFWRQVQANLRSGRIRMVFVSDVIGKELRRIVEWLNEQLRSAEVLAIEIAQFTNPNGVRTLVPQLVGATERAESAKAVVPKSPDVTDDEWMDEFRAKFGVEVGERARQLVGIPEAAGLKMRRGAGQKCIVLKAPDERGKDRGVIYLYESGMIEVTLGYFAKIPTLADVYWRQHILDRMQETLPSFKVPSKGIEGYPRTTLQTLIPQPVWVDFQAIVEEVVGRLRAAKPTDGADSPTAEGVPSTA